VCIIHKKKNILPEYVRIYQQKTKLNVVMCVDILITLPQIKQKLIYSAKKNVGKSSFIHCMFKSMFIPWRKKKSGELLSDRSVTKFSFSGDQLTLVYGHSLYILLKPIKKLNKYP